MELQVSLVHIPDGFHHGAFVLGDQQQEKAVKAGVATAILITMFTGLITNGVAAWRDIAVVKQRVKTLEEVTEKKDNDIAEIRKMVRDIHWHLIDSKEKR